MNVHHHTPTLSVMDPRALAVRSVGYCRHPDKSDVEPRITRQVFDGAGRLCESWDPRLWGTAPKANLYTFYGLNDQPLLTDSVDAGWQLNLLDQAGLPCSSWDARGNQRHTDHDNQQRPITVTEQASAELPRVVERLTYGGSPEAFIQHNQCGRLIRHDDPAGSQCFTDYGLAGSALVEERRFLTDLETPDWPDDPESREAWLEDQSFVTRHVFRPTGDIQRQTDAMGNDRTFGYDMAGSLSETWLLQAGDGQTQQRLVSDILYNAHSQIESETAGNGVVTRAVYSAEDGRLIRLMAQVGDQKPLQDLNYHYDQVGNIVELEDKSQAVTYFNNQRINPINRYRYDSLYQLVEAKGWEVSTPSHGPALPDLLPTPLDPNQRRNYTQHFDYDAAGNLITRHHSGAPGFSMFTSANCNRSLAQWDDGTLPGEPEIASGFDACGNQRELQRGQTMLWDIRNQLSRVTLVKRKGEADDYEWYAYDRPGHRLRKVLFSQTNRRTLRAEVRYLPNLEIHREADGQVHHVISTEAGRSSVRALHWPEGAHTDQQRYSLSDHLGSSTLELDEEAGVLTQEHYYPFGGTACWAGKSEMVAKYKTIRYSGKERDATGLYYYGYRYCTPWLQRWLSADPLGAVDGLNIYRYLENNPIIFVDHEGTVVLNFAEKALDSDDFVHSSLVVNYKIPAFVQSWELGFYLEQSEPGNSFAGIANVVSGEVNIYPLAMVRQRAVVEEWRAPFKEGGTHDGGKPIIHSPDNPVGPSHLQAIQIFKSDERQTVGFTLNDVRGLPLQAVEGYRSVPVLVGTSRSLNEPKTFKVPDDFVSGGDSVDDFSIASDMAKNGVGKVEKYKELSTEVKRNLLNMLVGNSDDFGKNASEFKQLFEAELHRPELQLRRKQNLVA
ncbi:hypothetical protein PS862_04293 [Pseudomonas fluorescens]|uniref:Uncharacterized protein n=1 Tax=Pseudomonas fluorescens TaxID=294 RepID=A0A5E6VDW9_PSEFL|nr:RHS repeat-associated core domain-containing protein [Pseudomonas fluorescens]VVN15950.1 hypothetical protein PS639_04036 [Pseudomonas fluorescens]VVP29611.1 hypothetical protein PS862_04293 [Pseudomonas fluorescens]